VLTAQSSASPWCRVVSAPLDVSGKTEAELTPALILQGFGLSTFDTILYNMIPGAIGIVSNIL
jgi:hypothetical protein